MEGSDEATKLAFAYRQDVPWWERLAHVSPLYSSSQVKHRIWYLVKCGELFVPHFPAHRLHFFRKGRSRSLSLYTSLRKAHCGLALL